MTKNELKTVVLWLGLLSLVTIAVSCAVISGAKVESMEQTVIENEKEIKALNADLKSYGGLLLDRDIRLQEKDSTIQMMSSQIEGLTWQLQSGGSQDE